MEEIQEKLKRNLKNQLEEIESPQKKLKRGSIVGKKRGNIAGKISTQASELWRNTTEIDPNKELKELDIYISMDMSNLQIIKAWFLTKLKCINWYNRMRKDTSDLTHFKN